MTDAALDRRVTTQPEPSSEPAGRPTLRQLALPLGVYLVSRVLTVAAVGLGTAPTPLTLLQALAIWDSEWYVNVAEQGYPGGDPYAATGVAGDPPSNSAFFPLFPLLVRALAGLTGMSTLAAGLVSATVLGAVAVCLLWVLTRRLLGPEVADRAAALWSFAPGAIVFTMAYSEPLMLTAALACLLALLAHRWVPAGLAAALATATRPNALVLVACCAWAAGVAMRRDRDWRALAAPLLAPAGMLAYFAVLWSRTGQPATWFIVQRAGWNERVDFGAANLLEIPRTLGLIGPPPNLTTIVAVAGLVVTVALFAVLAQARLPAVLVLYAVGICALAFASHTLGLRPRFVLTAFPLVIALARWADGWRFSIVLATSASLMTALAIIYTLPRAAVP